jgi:hypothetical protein
LRHARAAIRRGDDQAAQALFRASTRALLGEPPALPEPAAPVDPETARRREVAQAYAKTVVAGFGRAARH